MVIWSGEGEALHVFDLLWICRYSLKISFTFIGHLTDRLSGWLEKEGNISLELYEITEVLDLGHVSQNIQ